MYDIVGSILVFVPCVLLASDFGQHRELLFNINQEKEHAVNSWYEPTGMLGRVRLFTLLSANQSEMSGV